MKKVLIDEVGPRDGLQNIAEFIPTEKKIELIRAILDSGVSMMNLTSFVSPKAIPQLADARAVAEAILPAYPEVSFNALIPNLKGAQFAVEAGFREVVNVVSVSETHNLRNINRSHEQSFQALAEIRERYPDLKLIVGLATSFGCPFEGETSLEKLMSMVDRVAALGLNSIQLSDTIGVAYPTQVASFVDAVRAAYPEMEIGIHIHDTRNMGVINTYVAIEHGVDYIDSSVGGLGGCPFAPGASGNTSTEDLVYMLDKCGFETGIDFQKILAAARLAESVVKGGIFSGHQLKIKTSGSCC